MIKKKHRLSEEKKLIMMDFGVHVHHFFCSYVSEEVGQDHVRIQNAF